MDSQFKSPRPFPEEELLLCCSRKNLTPELLDRIRGLLATLPDWEYVLERAAFHGVIPLLHRSIGVCGAEHAPEQAWRRLRTHALSNVRHAFDLTSELIRLLRAFESRGIEAIPFKGLVLAASAYGDLTLRQYGDLDIAVRRKDIVEATSLILSRGYSLTSEADVASKIHDEVDDADVAFRGPQYYCFVRSDGRAFIDLQWRVSEEYFAFSLDKDYLWKRLVPVSVAGTSIRTFAPTDMLLILCVHGSKHRWEKLKWVCDVAELVHAEKAAIDWDALQRNAELQRTERMVRLGLFLAQELLGTELPEPVSRRVRADRALPSLARGIREKLFEASPAPRKLERIAFYLRTKDNGRDRLRFCRRYITQYVLAVFVPTPVDRAAFPLPACLAFVYYLFRPVRLLRKHGTVVLGRLFE